MDRYAETLGRYGVRERARVYSQQRSSTAAWNSEYENALDVHLRKKRKREPPQATASVSEKRRNSPYRVRNMAAGGRAPEASVHHASAAERVQQRRRPPREAPSAAPRRGPDARRNNDAIFTEGQNGRTRLEAYRLARAKKMQRRVRRVVSVMLLLILFSLCALALTYKLIYVIDDVTVTGTSRYSASEILEASGVSVGDNLYSFKASAAEARVTFRHPYVRQLQVRRSAPSSVLFEVTEDQAVFYAEIYGEVYELSDALRVLSRTTVEAAAENGLIRLRLPAVDSAVSGRVLSFAEEKYGIQIRKVLEQLESTDLMTRITSVDCRNPGMLQIVCDGQFLLDFGTLEDMEVKLKIAQAVLADELFSTGVKASVDLTSTGATSVVLDDQLDMDA